MELNIKRITTIKKILLRIYDKGGLKNLVKILNQKNVKTAHGAIFVSTDLLSEEPNSSYGYDLLLSITKDGTLYTGVLEKVVIANRVFAAPFEVQTAKGEPIAADFFTDNTLADLGGIIDSI